MKKYNNFPLFQEKKENFLFCLIWSNDVFAFPKISKYYDF